MNNPKLTSEQINFIASIINEHDPNVVKDHPQTDEFGELTGLHLDGPKSKSKVPTPQAAPIADPIGISNQPQRRKADEAKIKAAMKKYNLDYESAKTMLINPNAGITKRIQKLMRLHKTDYDTAKNMVLAQMEKGVGTVKTVGTDRNPVNPPYHLSDGPTPQYKLD